MMLQKLFTAAAVVLSLVGGNALAATDKAANQAEVRKVTQGTLEKFYKADPKLKAAVAAAPGYAVFTTYGLSFVIGGAGGKGLAHDNKTGKDTFMATAQASAGFQVGASESETLIVFKTVKGLEQFVADGWSAGGGGSIQAGAAGKSAGPAGGVDAISNAATYTLTKNGLNLGVAAAGSKFWTDKDLN